MHITILGAGHIGGTLGQKWAAAGHDVVMGVRHPGTRPSRAEPNEAGRGPRFGRVPGSTEMAEVVVLAVPGAAIESVLEQVGDSLDGKTVIDATNRIAGAKMHALDEVRRRAPGARLFRAFNSLGWEVFAQPVFAGQASDLLYCGEGDAEATRQVERLITDVGLRPIRVGGLDQVDLVDAFTRLWLTLARMPEMGRHLGIKLLTDRP